MNRTDLKGGCYVLDGAGAGNTILSPVIGADFGAAHLSQMALNLDGPSPIFQFGRSDVLIFVTGGTGRAIIGGKSFDLEPKSGLYVRPNEAVQISPKGPMKALLTICPEDPTFRVMKTMPNLFDGDYPTRLVGIDPAKTEAMGERFFQVLVSKQIGSENVTQFIGEIPLGKAPSHHHLYEEAIYVLEGTGKMWTGEESAPVKAGSIIFLPAKQEHALECTSLGGLKVAGHFYPAGSPAENY
ncbi:MAG: cupin domain-containing protein [Alphaproteobacteria bacterium]